jgi:hypothetical protein
MTPVAIPFMLGVIAALSLVAAAFFCRFYRETRDPLFALFGAAFGLEGLARTALAFCAEPREAGPLPYVLRAVSYGLILAAIWSKNRRGRGRT